MNGYLKLKDKITESPFRIVSMKKYIILYLYRYSVFPDILRISKRGIQTHVFDFILYFNKRLVRQLVFPLSLLEVFKNMFSSYKLVPVGDTPLNVQLTQGS